jgi:hypothetical protein
MCTKTTFLVLLSPVTFLGKRRYCIVHIWNWIYFLLSGCNVKETWNWKWLSPYYHYFIYLYKDHISSFIIPCHPFGQRGILHCAHLKLNLLLAAAQNYCQVVMWRKLETENDCPLTTIILFICTKTTFLVLLSPVTLLGKGGYCCYLGCLSVCLSIHPLALGSGHELTVFLLLS